MEKIAQAAKPGPDFKLPAPKDGAAKQPEAPVLSTPSTAPMSASTTVAAVPRSDVYVSLDQTDYLISAGIMVVLAILVFFGRGALISHLVSSRASPSVAIRTGWFFFFFVLCAAALGVFGYFANFFLVLVFWAPLALLTIIFFILFVASYAAARR